MASPHAVTGIDSTTYEYDWNGNLTSDGTWTYTWDQKNWLTGATDGTTTLEYAYDENGERAIKENQTTSTQTLYINRYYELDATVPQTHIYAGDLKVATVEDGTDVIYHHADHLTGTNVDTDDSGTVLEVLDYYPYGNVRLDEKSGTYENAYKYTGKELDEETNLYYYGARYYNAAIGRFVSQDPWGGDITDPQSFNKYSYVMNNPMRYTDMSGEKPGDPFNSMNEAARDFGMTYNDNSIRNNLEYASSIFSFKDNTGNIQFSYTVPNVGAETMVHPSQPVDLFEKVGTIHTHAAFVEGEPERDRFSPVDLSAYLNSGLMGYVVVPNGSLLRFDPEPAKTTIINTDMPSDTNDPTRKNNINPNSQPSNEPTQTWIDRFNDVMLNISTVTQSNHIKKASNSNQNTQNEKNTDK